MAKDFKQKSAQQEQGFTLVEVLTAILITVFFVAVAMQGMVIAALFKAKAQAYTEATSWIQQDLENNVKYKADNYQFPQTMLAANAVTGVSSINVTSSSNFANNDDVKVGLDTAKYTITAISGNTLTITPALKTTQLQNAAVITTKMCTATTFNAGLADALRDSITGSNLTANTNDVDIAKESVRTGNEFTLRRTTTISSNAPYKVLQVSYTVFPSSGGSSVASIYTEVIPNVAFQCP